MIVRVAGGSRDILSERQQWQIHFWCSRTSKTRYNEEPIVVDWDGDGDGDLDVILRKVDGLSLFELKSGRHFVEVEPNPFHGIPGGYCRPAVVDWDGDGRLDLIVGAEDEAAIVCSR